MATYKQYVLPSAGAAFSIESTPTPTPAAGQVLVRNTSISMNPLDPKQAKYGIMVFKWPAILGIEAAGVVEAVGPDVTSVKVGDEVFARTFGDFAPGGGAFQEKLLMTDTGVTKKPKNISLDDVSTAPVGFMTALAGVHAAMKIPVPFLEGSVAHSDAYGIKSVLILGGSGAVGSSAIQLLKLADPSIKIYATSSPKHHQHLLNLGATQVFDHRDPGHVAAIKAASGGVDAIYDTVRAGITQTDICDTLSAQGPKIYRAVITGQELKLPEGVNFKDTSGFDIFAEKGGMTLFQTMVRLIEEGKYVVSTKTRVVGKGIGALPEAMKEMEKGVSGEKLVVQL